MNLAGMMRAMKAAGCTVDQVAEAVAFLDEERRAKTRVGNARRQREHRERRRIRAGHAVTTVIPSGGE